MLCTALARKRQKVIVLHRGSATDLQRLSAGHYSATATRLTNMFGSPRPLVMGDIFLEDRLIHRTKRGEAVRSNSEVIIGNLLHAKGIDYHYQHSLELNGVVKYPDFTIEDDETGISYCTTVTVRARSGTRSTRSCRTSSAGRNGSGCAAWSWTSENTGLDTEPNGQ